MPFAQVFQPPYPHAAINVLAPVPGGAADPTGTVDSTASIQAKVDALAAAGGGVITGPAGTYIVNNLILKQGVTIDFLLGTHPEPSSSVNPAIFKGTAAGWVIDTPATLIFSCAVRGLSIGGGGAGANNGGIRFRNVTYGAIARVACDEFDNQGVMLGSSSLGCVLEDIQTTNCILNRSPGAVIGSVDVDGSDHYLSRLETTISGQVQGTVQSPNLFCTALLVRATNCFLDNCIGELSDVGIQINGNSNRLSNCRADHNFGPGFVINGAVNQLTNAFALDNSQDTTNTYDGFVVNTGNNSFSMPVINSDVAKVHRYGINDQAASSGTVKNLYTNPAAYGYGTAAFNFPNSGPGTTLPDGPIKTLTVNSATPDVTGWRNWGTGNTLATTITNFTGGIFGQVIDVFAGDANTTIQHNGGTIVLPNAGNVKLRSGIWYRFINSGAWYMATQDPIGLPNVSADNGDAAATLQFRLQEPTQIWNTPLTADRAVTLSTTGAYAGAKFRVVRGAGATGAHNLNVGTGPLKALGTAGTWVDVEYSGSAWIETASGSL